jgi:hypothetical protein
MEAFMASTAGLSAAAFRKLEFGRAAVATWLLGKIGPLTETFWEPGLETAELSCDWDCSLAGRLVIPT